MGLDTEKEIEQLQAEIEQLSNQLQQAEQARNSITATIFEKASALKVLRNSVKG